MAPAALEQRIGPDSYPDHVQGRGGQGTIPPAVHHKPERPQDVQEVGGQAFRLEPARRQQRVRSKNQEGTCPPDHFNSQLHRVSAGNVKVKLAPCPTAAAAETRPPSRSTTGGPPESR